MAQRFLPAAEALLALYMVNDSTDCTRGGCDPTDTTTVFHFAFAMMRAVTNNGPPSFSCSAEGMTEPAYNQRI
jgi:hypothetical protein